jgi:hypothetical protein
MTTPRWPVTGADDDVWNNLMAEFVTVAHNANGTLKQITQCAAADADTYLDFSTADQVSLWAGGVEFIRLTKAAADKVWINGNVGIGTTAPDTRLTVTMGGALAAPFWAYTVAHMTAVDGYGPVVMLDGFGENGSYQMRRANGTAAAPTAILKDDEFFEIVGYGHAATGWPIKAGGKICFSASENWTDTAQGSHIGFYTRANGLASAYTERMKLDSAGNLLLVPAKYLEAPVSTAGAIVLCNGTAPGASMANGVVLWAEDVAASSELRVRDEAGNVTTLSPHRFDLFSPDPGAILPWSYYSERDGKKINVDMYGAIAAIERLSGKKFIFSGPV